MTKPLLIATVVGVGSGALGIFVGYKLAEKRLGAEFDERLERETAGMREYYQVVKKPYATPQEAAAALIEQTEETSAEEEEESPAALANQKVAYHKIVRKEYKPEDDPEEEHAVEAEVGPALPDPIEQNLFESDPVIISQEDFMENETGWVQGTLTYYEGDQALADSNDQVIENKNEVIGDRNLSKFGTPQALSSDPNIIHVRNGRLQMEFEVCRSPNSFRREVLGIDDEPQERPSGRTR